MSGPVVLVLRILLAVALYGFLGYALFTLAGDIKSRTIQLTTRKVPPLALVITQPTQAQFTRHFQQAEIIIGRNPDCECVIEDETVSSRHARLSFHHGQWWLEDLGSTNGTHLNNGKLAIPTVVISQDCFRCGEATLEIRLSGDLLPISATGSAKNDE